PLVCSRVGHIPDLVGDAALLIEPDDVAGLAKSIGSIWSDGNVASELARRAAAKSWRHDWREVARDFRAQYRYVAGAHLGTDDIARLARQGLPISNSVRR